jgi:hypothetical protein
MTSSELSKSMAKEKYITPSKPGNNLPNNLGISQIYLAS